ncbi:MAG: NTP transferase domain-containing protein [Firmicutes bacterium]|nr:NTP transferase domain-containing protein [Bacillota bacterium]
MATKLPPAVVLAGGLGTRLRTTVPGLPKALAPIANEPFLAHQLRWLEANGIKSVLLCVGYKGEQIFRKLGTGAGLGLSLKLHYSWETFPLGTGGALMQAAPVLPEEFLVINGDTYTEMGLGPLWQAHQNNDGLVTIAVTKAWAHNATGSVELANDGRITSFNEKQPNPTWANMGIYAMSKKLLDHMPAHRPCSLEKEVFPHIQPMHAFITDSPFIDIGTPESYAYAQSYFASRNKSKTPVSKWKSTEGEKNDRSQSCTIAD